LTLSPTCAGVLASVRAGNMSATLAGEWQMISRVHSSILKGIDVIGCEVEADALLPACLVIEAAWLGISFLID
jgi:hypothetical protein